MRTHRKKDQKKLFYTSETFAKRLPEQLALEEEKVAHILLHYPKTRSNDTLLVLYYWKLYEKEQQFLSLNRIEEYAYFTPPSTIFRCRQKIQNELLMFRPEQTTLEMREVREQMMKQYYGLKL